MARLQLDTLSKRYGDFYAAQDVSLDIADGEFLTLLGPSGCGKTTTLRMVAGFVEPTSGMIHIGEREVTDLPPWRRNTGLVFQNYALFPHMSVAQNVGFGLEMRGVAKAEREPRILEALRLVRLEHLADRLPRQLSGGQQQRVALARALAFQPDVLLLDEPLSNLDAKLRQEVRLEIRNLQQRLGITTVMVTHDQEEALTMADRLVVMADGQIQQVGTQRDLYERPATPFVAGFVGRSTFLRGRMKADVLVLESGLSIRCGRRLVGDAVLALRPERVTLTAEPPTGFDNVFIGEVEIVSYMGGLTDVHVRISPSDLIVAQIANGEGVRLPEVGNRVHVAWSSNAAIFAVPREKQPEAVH
ncbi:ABC transporter ATP-binding protein [Halotalea alkalilenta]|uniref:Spermidine/putrescine import ATP-binding protein PotA n=1 Tax=Halotalea alkalilenta TaxID=376489 RepID=A0A172YD87_9GAMM|nr:ABC transporter ATP-binding protein [Halotalea alkalilenta]ANF57183.1 Fe3+/spermidine/putrescine ABC transporter ATP-binding protein [Halotalea alkalilenta]